MTASIDYRDASVNLLFIYCIINMASISNFCKFLRSIHQLIETDIPLVIMGDTNIDFFTQREFISGKIECKTNNAQFYKTLWKLLRSCLYNIHVKFRYFLCLPRIILFRSQTNHCIFAPVKVIIPTNEITFIVPLKLLYLKNVFLKLMFYVYKFIILKILIQKYLLLTLEVIFY